MEIQIIEKKANMVYVKSSIGSFKAYWCSSMPIVSKKYIVELDSDDILTSDMIKLSNCCNPSINNCSTTIIVVGFVEEIQDNLMFLRLQESLMMLEISSYLDFIQYIGHYVRIQLSDIKLYNIEE